MLYLASPYIHKNPEVIEERVQEADKAAAHFTDKGLSVYSPITHGHRINKHMKAAAGTHKFWLDICYPFVARSDGVYVLCQEGWKVSKGVRWECETAWSFNIPVWAVDPITYKLSSMLKPENWDPTILSMNPGNYTWMETDLATPSPEVKGIKKGCCRTKSSS